MRTRVPFTPRPIPGGDAAAFVSARFKGSAVDDVWPCTGSVSMTADDARRIAPYLPEDAVVEQLEDDRARVTLGSWSWDGLAGVVSGLAVDFVVASPDELVEAVADLADRLRAAGTRGPA